MKRNNPYTAEEDARIRAQITAFEGSKIPANIYKTLAWVMGNRHSVSSLETRASRLRHGRKYGELAASPEKTCSRESKTAPMHY